LKNTFHKTERLYGKSAIDALFKKGTIIAKAPLKMVLLGVNEQMTGHSARAMFVVPKKNLKKAVHRNLIKRKMREAYRLQKNDWYNQLIATGANCHCAFLYTSREIPDFDTILQAVRVLLGKSINKLKAS